MMKQAHTICALMMLGCLSAAGCTSSTYSSPDRPRASTRPVPADDQVEPFIEEAPAVATSSTRAPRAAFVTLAERGESQLCTLLTPADLEPLLGPSLPPSFVPIVGVGAGCRWTTRDRTTAVSFTVLASTTFAQGEAVAQAAARQELGTEGRSGSVAGRAARIFDPVDRDPLNADARVVVALGDPSDPVVEVRSPDPALSLALAQTIVPRLIALAATPLPSGATSGIGTPSSTTTTAPAAHLIVGASGDPVTAIEPMTPPQGAAMSTAPLQTAIAATRAQLAATTADQLDLQTPCESWKVRDLINHVIGAEHFFLAGAAGTPPSNPGTDFASGDFVAAFDDAAGKVVAAFGVEGVMDKTLTTPLGPMPGAAFAGLAANGPVRARLGPREGDRPVNGPRARTCGRALGALPQGHPRCHARARRQGAVRSKGRSARWRIECGSTRGVPRSRRLSRPGTGQRAGAGFTTASLDAVVGAGTTLVATATSAAIAPAPPQNHHAQRYPSTPGEPV